jgi:hypothetical protein
MSDAEQAPFPEVGWSVWYIDEKRDEHLALVTAVWGQPGPDMPAINLCYVSPDECDRDEYGRKLIRKSSVVFCKQQSAPGNYWGFVNDEGDER